MTIEIQQTLSDYGDAVWSIALPDGRNYYGREVVKTKRVELPEGFYPAESYGGDWLVFRDRADARSVQEYAVAYTVIVKRNNRVALRAALGGDEGFEIACRVS